MLAASLRTYPLVALLVCYGIFSVLILRRAYKLDRALDDPARIAAIRPLIAQEGEQETSWDERAGAAVVHLVGEVASWGFFGLLYLAFGERAYLVVVLIGLGLFLALMLWRVSKLHIKALVGRIEIEARAVTALGLLIIAAICLASFFLMLLVFDHPTESSKVRTQAMPTLSLLMPTFPPAMIKRSRSHLWRSLPSLLGPEIQNLSPVSRDGGAAGRSI